MPSHVVTLRARERRAPKRVRDEDASDASAASEDDDEDVRPRRRSSRRAPSPSDSDSSAVEIEGTEYRLEHDALVLPTDAAGETKVDAHGALLGGRTYRVAPFTLPMRDDPERLYMLSIDVARACGFRDSAYFFRKNPLLHKIVLSFDEKDHLIAAGRISGQLRARNVTMIAARSVFQQLGARIVQRGRHVTDDYYEADARADPARREGTLVSVPSIDDMLRVERRRDADRERGRRRDASTYTTIDAHGETVVTTFGDGGQSPFERAALWPQRRAALQRANVTEENWALETARSVQALNAELADARRERLVAFRGSGARVPSAPAPPMPAAEPASADLLDMDDRPPWARPPHAADALRDARVRARRAAAAHEPPLGTYEPHTHMAHVAAATQPTRAFCTRTDARGAPGVYAVTLGIGAWP